MCHQEPKAKLYCIGIQQGVYGPHSNLEQEELWLELASIRGIWNEQWVIGGHFNVLLGQSDVSGWGAFLKFVLDAYRKGDKLKFANHSPNPNFYAKRHLLLLMERGSELEKLISVLEWDMNVRKKGSCSLLRDTNENESSVKTVQLTSLPPRVDARVFELLVVSIEIQEAYLAETLGKTTALRIASYTLQFLIREIACNNRNIQRNKQQAYRNFKGFDMRFTFIAAAWEGTAHDSRVLENVIVDPELKSFVFTTRYIT
ncbi:hypothetical protein CQW23_34435 [Capsicum baccatum]|uniref:Uncharacterized protein n=1 Tax=Capsicum baccatum TaxID=33114 RepID=A0A2G2UYX4_CAPBA|nr:hypothetical protein CQW23_34435 [Capsicum baccatum]